MAENLTTEVKSWGNQRVKSGPKGLELIVKAIELIASRDDDGNPIRNWDALAWLYSYMRETAGRDEANKMYGEENILRLYIRAAFGTGKQAQLRLKTVGVKHKSGVEFEFTSNIPDGPKGAPVLRNSWGLIKQSLDKKLPFNHPPLLKALRKELNEVKAPQLFDTEKAKALAKRTADKLEAEHFDPRVYMIILCNDLGMPVPKEWQSAAEKTAETGVIDIDDLKASTKPAKSKANTKAEAEATGTNG